MAIGKTRAPREERATSASQRSRIRHIAAQLFAAKGYNGVGIAEVGSAVGLARGALYYHIGSKEDLLYDIATEYITRLVEEGKRILVNNPEPVERIRQLSSHLINTISQHRAELTVCFREVHALTGDRYSEVAHLHSEYQKIWEQATKDGAEKDVFRPISIVALKGLLGMYFYSFLWMNPSGKSTPQEISDTFSDLVLRALATGSSSSSKTQDAGMPQIKRSASKSNENGADRMRDSVKATSEVERGIRALNRTISGRSASR